MFRAEAYLSIVDVFPQQNQSHTHGSNIQFFAPSEDKNGILFVTWFQGDGEEKGNNVQIFGSMQTPGSNSWSQPQPLTAKNIGYPDNNPALYVREDSEGNNVFYLFWGKIYEHVWQGTQVRQNTAIFNWPITSFQDFEWTDPTLQGISIETTFSPNYASESYNLLQNTWPLKNGHFNPSAFPSIKIINKKDVPLMYQDLHHLLFQYSPHSLDAPIPTTSLHLDTKCNANLFYKLITLLYHLHDSHIYEEINQTLLNPTSIFCDKIWQTRCNPIIINYQCKSRMILPLYSDHFGFSLIFYSDDYGNTWKQSTTPIMGRKVVQPSIVQLQDGSLMALMRNNGWCINLNKMLISFSKDGGNTWSPTIPHKKLPNYSSSLSIIKLQYGKHRGLLALAYNNNLLRSNLTLALSEDNGNTWKQKVLEQSKGIETFEYPSITQATNGKIYISFTHKRGAGTCSSFFHAPFPCQNIGVVCVDPSDVLVN